MRKKKHRRPQRGFDSPSRFDISATPAPPGSLSAPFLFQACSIAYDDFLGRKACGRVLEGHVKKGQQILHISSDGKKTKSTVTCIEGHVGLERVELPEAGLGDIVNISGIPDVMIGDTLSSPENTVVLAPIKLDEPTVSVDIAVNSGPFAGRSGKHVTMNKIIDRMEREKKGQYLLSHFLLLGRASKKSPLPAGENCILRSFWKRFAARDTNFAFLLLRLLSKKSTAWPTNRWSAFISKFPRTIPDRSSSSCPAAAEKCSICTPILKESPIWNF